MKHDVVIHYCPNCGGPLTFHPEDQKFHCPFCLSIFTVDELTKKEAEIAKKEALSKEKTSETTDSNTAISDDSKEDFSLFLCPSCGAEIVTTETTAATYCYFCHNPVVLKERLSGSFLPEKVLPFKLTKEQATKSFLNWVQKKKFVPKDFFSEKQIEKITGVYFPYWNIAAKTKGTLKARGTRLRVWRVGDIEYTETKQYEVTRSGNLAFKDYVKAALSKNIQENMVTSIQPFPLEEAEDFNSLYLTGYQAEKRDVEYPKIEQQVTEELTEFSGHLLEASAPGYTTLTKEQLAISLVDSQKDYLLLPVWLLTYRNPGDKTIYYYAMNGATGKVAGVLPVSKKRLGFFSGGIAVVTLLLGLLGGYFL